MGMELTCSVVLNGVASEGRAHCGDGEIDFRGDFRFRWRWQDLASVSASDGELRVIRGSDTAVFRVGGAADKWADAILNPKSRIAKFGLKATHRYRAEGEFDPGFFGELEQVAGTASGGVVDILFVQIGSVEELHRLTQARDSIAPNGMVWAVWAKGRKEFGENHIREFALSNGLVDVKVARFNDELSALKLVIPVALR